ncbi:hypothetical protein DSECCO2_436680 [anaerobic digester metagenome]
MPMAAIPRGRGVAEACLNPARMRHGWDMEFSTEWWLLAIGFLGQAFFFMRFFWQWVVSEKEKRSVIPVSFWYFSLLGSFFLLAYAILRRDIVFIVGQSTGSVIYMRNLYLIHRERTRAQREG